MSKSGVCDRVALPHAAGSPGRFAPEDDESGFQARVSESWITSVRAERNPASQYAR